jgi:sugar (pentulose or hexulose) kinase
MIKQVILGVDLSTHGAKVLAIDASGGILAHCCQPYERLIGSDGSQIQPFGRR